MRDIKHPPIVNPKDGSRIFFLSCGHIINVPTIVYFMLNRTPRIMDCSECDKAKNLPNTVSECFPYFDPDGGDLL